MPQKPETRLTRSLIKHARERGAWAEKIHGNIYQSGLPDIIGCHYGIFFGAEVKIPKRRNKVTPLQLRTLAKIQKAGGVAGVVTSIPELDKLLDECEEDDDD